MTKGFDGTDYPDADNFSIKKEDDIKIMLDFIKKMYKILIKQPSSHLKDPKNKKFVDELIEEYEQVKEDGWDPIDILGLYANFQYAFTDADQSKYLALPKKEKSLSSKKVIKKESDGPIASPMDIDELSLKRVKAGMLIQGIMKRIKKLMEEDDTPERTRSLNKLKKKLADSDRNWQSANKRIQKYFPNYDIERVQNLLDTSRDEVQTLKNILQSKDEEIIRLKKDLSKIKNQSAELQSKDEEIEKLKYQLIDIKKQPPPKKEILINKKTFLTKQSIKNIKNIIWEDIKPYF